MDSVLAQDYPALEYVVVDGGSSDGSREIIEEYRSKLHAVIMEPDDGHADAINKGFSRTTGDIMGWINSDDLLHQNSLATVDAIFAAFPDVDWITGIPTTAVGDHPSRIKVRRGRRFTYGDFLAGDYRWVQQESTFWRRSLWDQAGGSLNADLRLATDLELWIRFFRHTRMHSVEVRIGAFRRRPGQRSKIYRRQYLEEAERVLTSERKMLREEVLRVPPEHLERSWRGVRMRRLQTRFGLHRNRFDISRSQITDLLKWKLS